jgi:hypothetical protein
MFMYYASILALNHFKNKKISGVRDAPLEKPRKECVVSRIKHFLKYSVLVQEPSEDNPFV